MGLTDVGGITGRVVERAAPADAGHRPGRGAGRRGPQPPGLAKIARRDPRLTLHVDTPHMARLTAEADIGDRRGGVLDLGALHPGPAVPDAGPGREPAAGRPALAERGAALVVDAADPDFEQAFDRALLRLLSDAAARRRFPPRAPRSATAWARRVRRRRS